MKKPTPPKKPPIYYYKNKTKIVIDFNTVRTIVFFILASSAAFIFGKFVVNTQPNGFFRGILAFITLPIVGLILGVPILFFSIFSKETYRKEIRKSKKQIEQEESEYQSELNLYKLLLGEYEKEQLEKRKKFLEETKRKEEIRRAEEIAELNEIRRKNLEETKRKDEIRIAKEIMILKEIARKNLEESERIAKERKDNESTKVENIKSNLQTYRLTEKTQSTVSKIVNKDGEKNQTEKKKTSTNTLLNKDDITDELVNGIWEMKYIGCAENYLKDGTFVLFFRNGNFFYKGSISRWLFSNNKIEIQINDNYAILNGELISNTINGKAKNIKNNTWNFEIKRTKKIKNNYLNSSMMIGTMWNIKHHHTSMTDTFCKFIENGKLKYRGKIDWKWEIDNNEIILYPETNYIKIICRIDNNNLYGYAENNRGVKWLVEGGKNEPEKIYRENIATDIDPELTNELLNIDDSNVKNRQPILIENKFKKYQFTIESVDKYSYKWYALWQYYPVNKFSALNLHADDLNNRNLIFKFKDGIDSILFSKIVGSALINKFNFEVLKDKVLLIVPASNKSRTEKRFRLFCENLCSYTCMLNGYEYLTNNETIRTPTHQGGNKNQSIISSVQLTKSIVGKDFIIVDDVRTSGKSSNDIFEFLKKNGAGDITFVYLGRTVSSQNLQSNYNRNDDLPF